MYQFHSGVRRLILSLVAIGMVAFATMAGGVPASAKPPVIRGTAMQASASGSDPTPHQKHCGEYGYEITAMDVLETGALVTLMTKSKSKGRLGVCMRIQNMTDEAHKVGLDMRKLGAKKWSKKTSKSKRGAWLEREKNITSKSGVEFLARFQGVAGYYVIGGA